MTAAVGRVLVAGVGNIFNSDDGFGCEVARRLLTRELPPHVTVIDYGIRGMHLAYDLLDGYAALIIVDASPRGGSPGDLVTLEVGVDDIASGGFDAHGMNPTAVLANLGALGGELPPTFVVGCEPGSLAEEIGLSPDVTAAVDRAASLVMELLSHECATARTHEREKAS